MKHNATFNSTFEGEKMDRNIVTLFIKFAKILLNFSMVELLKERYIRKVLRHLFHGFEEIMYYQIKNYDMNQNIRTYVLLFTYLRNIKNRTMFVYFWIKQTRNSRIHQLKSYKMEKIQITIFGCVN